MATHDSTFCYFRHVRELFPPHSVWTAEICKYISELELESEFTTRFGDFQMYGPVFSFLIKPDDFSSLIEWLDTHLENAADLAEEFITEDD